MSVSISYDSDRRLTIAGLECGCGLKHAQPTQDIYVGSGIVNNTAAYIQKARSGHALCAGGRPKHLAAGGQSTRGAAGKPRVYGYPLRDHP